jgi:hypothetical protein
LTAALLALPVKTAAQSGTVTDDGFLSSSSATQQFNVNGQGISLMAKRRALAEEADGSGAGFSQEGHLGLLAKSSMYSQIQSLAIKIVLIWGLL